MKHPLTTRIIITDTRGGGVTVRVAFSPSVVRGKPLSNGRRLAMALMRAMGAPKVFDKAMKHFVLPPRKAKR